MPRNSWCPAKTLTLGVGSELPAQTVALRARIDRQVWFNPMTYVYGLGLAADLPFPRAYDYPSKWVDLETGETRRIRKHNNPHLLTPRERVDAWKAPYYKGRFDLLFTLSVFNTSRTHVSLDGGYDNRSGWAGFSLGAEYFYTDRRSLAVEISRPSSRSAWVILMPILWPFTKSPSRKSWHVALYDNLHWPRFSFGYGLNLAYYRYKEWLDEEPDGNPIDPRIKITESHTGIGPMVNVYWKAARNTRIGLTYKTSLYRFSGPQAWKYEHNIGLDLKFNLTLGKRSTGGTRPDAR